MGNPNYLLNFNNENYSENFDRIVLVMTRSCMLSCSYCYVKKENVHMRYNVLYKSLLAISKMKKSRPITIIFFGGEPLIRYDFIKLAILILNKIDKKNIKKYDFCLFTNGVLLNNIDLSFLKKFNVRLAISLDGDKKTHNKNRGRKYVDSYNSIIKTMPTIKSFGIHTTVFSTLTPYAVKNLYRNYLFFKKLGFSSIEICPVLYSSDIKLEPWNKHILNNLKNQLIKIIKNYFKDNFNAELCFFRIYKKQHETGLDYMELGQKELVIDINGDIFIGDECLGLDKKDKKQLKIGNVLKNNNLDILFKKYINNLKVFRSFLLKNPIVRSYRNSSVIKAIEVMNKLIANYIKKI